MVSNRFFSTALILVVGLFLAVLFLPGGAFAQDTDTGSGSKWADGACRRQQRNRVRLAP